MSATERDPRAAELERLGGSSARTLRGREARRAAASSWRRGGAWMIAVASLALLLVLGARAFGVDGRHSGFPLLAALILLPPALAALLAAANVLARAPESRDGLARLDRELRTADRLQTAQTFEAAARRTAFMEAAIEDADESIALARAHRLAAEASAPLASGTWLPAGLALTLAALAVWLQAPASPAALPPQADAGAEGARTAGDRPPVPPPPDDAQAPPPAAEREAARPREPGAAGAAAESKPQSPSEQDPKRSRGATGEGSAATPAQASASSESQGFPSAKADSKEAADPGKVPPPRARKPKDPAAAPPRKNPTEESGSTAGKGVGHGSSRNPGSTDWESKDQTSTDEEDPLDDEEEVDDEDSESEARGGLQPSLRDRRPAVNRDLRIGFGNRPNPDANGRGSGGEQKKSRGVASLVLGVPIPDHVKGKPNPGRTKITQERVEPQAEDAAPVDAGARSPRSGSPGFLSQFELEPWMRALVRGYFDRGGAPARPDIP